MTQQEFVAQLDKWFKLAFVDANDVCGTTLPRLARSEKPNPNLPRNKSNDYLWEWEINQSGRQRTNIFLLEPVNNRTPIAVNAKECYRLWHYPTYMSVWFIELEGKWCVFACDGVRLQRYFPWTPAGFGELVRAMLQGAGEVYYAA